ncbi:ArsR family transcriptional regulator [Halobaculum sp. WSA2]|uniref:ArsR family transcriptional regulator n=1 Tax=Halobaculum saliterrae TaxID=2073113 RepID=A0A6B0SYX5_9EURY|nr:ArsR family transcriptional regulator [Halobaculum saliterrae]MXR41542.1 ArsR family transcriptional regulator [Halobaculum saliterrae]
MEGAQASRTLDDCLDALGHSQRRKLLRAVLHNPEDDGSVRIDSDESNRKELERLVEMNHVHLPKLEDAGFITWDRNADEVSKGPNFEEIRPLLEILVSHADELPDGWL